ncbi:MAG: hypothetical protein CFE21_16505 [Bacteroidetes bacterium B1(2017)]|nr:MAG: hypothetical protein CFE21_16505 [Bacteroidetes bacterium B1(2017)]
MKYSLNKLRVIFSIIIFLPQIGFSKIINFEVKNLFSLTDTTRKNNSYVFSVIPIFIDGLYNGSGTGLGASIEKKKSEKLGIYFPLHIIVNTKFGISTSPTLKFYPFGQKKILNWSVGPGIRFSNVREKYYEWNPQISDLTLTQGTSNYFGLEVHNGINVSVDNFSLSINNSMGISIKPHFDYIRFLSLGVGYKF